MLLFYAFSENYKINQGEIKETRRLKRKGELYEEIYSDRKSRQKTTARILRKAEKSLGCFACHPQSRKPQSIQTPSKTQKGEPGMNIIETEDGQLGLADVLTEKTE